MVYYTELVDLYYLHPVLWVEMSNTSKSGNHYHFPSMSELYRYALVRLAFSR